MLSADASTTEASTQTARPATLPNKHIEMEKLNVEQPLPAVAPVIITAEDLDSDEDDDVGDDEAMADDDLYIVLDGDDW
jgi:hypothetical protein